MRTKKPWTFDASSGLFKDKANENFETFLDEFNGNIDDTNIKNGAGLVGSKFRDASIPGTKLVTRQIGDSSFDYTSARVIRVGPNVNANGPNGVRKVSGRLAITALGGVSHTRVWVPYSVRANEGNPRFNHGPTVRVTLAVEIPIEAFVRWTAWLDHSLATGFILKVSAYGALGVDKPLFVHWTATGGI